MNKDIYLLEIIKKEFLDKDKKTVSYYRATIVMDGILHTDFPVDATLGRSLEELGALKKNLAVLLEELGFAKSSVVLSVSDDAKLKLKEVKA